MNLDEVNKSLVNFHASDRHYPYDDRQAMILYKIALELEELNRNVGLVEYRISNLTSSIDVLSSHLSEKF